MILGLLIIFGIGEIFCVNNEELFKEMGRLTQHCLDLTCTNLHDLREADKTESSLRKDVNCLRMCIFLHAKEVCIRKNKITLGIFSAYIYSRFTRLSFADGIYRILRKSRFKEIVCNRCMCMKTTYMGYISQVNYISDSTVP